MLKRGQLNKMDISKLSSVALCGTTEPDLLSLLQERFIRVITWSPYISALICGTDHESRWKFAAAQRLHIPCYSSAAVLAALQTPPAPAETDLWVDKYKPKTLSNVLGHAEQIKNLTVWLTNWHKDKVLPRGAFVTGPPGIGKTTVVHLVVAACGYDVVELNASNERSASAIRRVFEEAARSAHVGKPRVIVMDEVDGMSSGDRGGIGELARIIKTCTFPIICIANERTTPRLRPIASACFDVKFSRPFRSTIARGLMGTVVKAEGLKISAAELEELCERNGNDIRQILNFLQFCSLFPVGAK